MARRKVSRKELLKKPDEFITISARAVNFVKGHSRVFEYLGIGVACLILISLGINTYIKSLEKKGQESYGMAYQVLAKNMGIEKNQDDLEYSEELLDRVIHKYGVSKAARLALPELANLKFLQKKYDEAISEYQEFLKKDTRDPYQSLARLAIAVCYEEKGELDEAMGTLEHIRSGPNDFIKEQAMLSMARIYRLKNEENKSNEILEEFTETFTTSPFLPLARALIKP
jgi:predicted negative regulator of RcsB-dependent stress response